ncbi:MAG: phosphocholine cytidylyltransferase family protein [Candidatus Neomarinimicrobiota bacterium]
MPKVTQAVIVAAGVGSRLKPYTDDRPKTLLEVNGQSMLRRSVDIMLEQGIGEIVVVVGYRRQMIMDHLKGYPATYILNPFYRITNNMASLWFALPWLMGDFIYAHSDLVYDAVLMDALVNDPNDTALLVEEKLCGDEEMKVIAANGLLVESSKCLAPEQCLGEWTGIAKFSNAFRPVLDTKIGALLEDGRLQDYDTAAFTELAHEGHKIPILPFTDHPWLEVDTEEDLLEAREIFGG